MTHRTAGPALNAEVAERVMGGATNCDFRCPRCEGSYFGSSFSADMKIITSRDCHDEFDHRCRWSGNPGDALPSFEQIAEHFGYNSLATVHEHLSNLVSKGWLDRVYGEARSTTVTLAAGAHRSAQLQSVGGYERPSE